MPAFHVYRAFGLAIASAIPIPEMVRVEPGIDEATAGDVLVRIGPAPRPPGLEDVVTGVAAGPHDFWMAVPGVAQLHVSGGALIIIEPAPGAALDDVRAYLLGSAMGALLHQRGCLPLHASAVTIGERAVAFCGTSGAGKSTLALALVRRGHRLICDDIAAVTIADDGPHIRPGLANLKLWRDSLEAAGETPAALEPVLAAMDKYKLPVAALAPDAPYRLDRVMSLAFADDPEPLITPLAGAAGAAALVANSFRGQLVAPMGIARAHFERCVALAGAARVARLSRPRSLAAIDDVCAAIERALEND